MPVGDVISYIVNIGAGASLIWHPPVGTEEIIYGCASTSWVGIIPDMAPEISVRLFNGVIETSLTNGDNQYIGFVNMKLFINNSIYLKVLNLAGFARNISIWGIIIKQ